MILFPLDYEGFTPVPEYYHRVKPLNLVFKYQSNVEFLIIHELFQSLPEKNDFRFNTYPEKSLSVITAGMEEWLTFCRKNTLEKKTHIQDFISQVSFIINNLNHPAKSIPLKAKSLNLDKPLIMGIVNITDNSFYDGGRYFDPKQASIHAKDLIQAGADIIDIGGESSRPGSESVNADEEMARVIPVISEIRKEFDIPVSIDTVKCKVAEASVKAGADIINDISALSFDPDMGRFIRDSGVPAVLMHMKGEPKTMQDNPHYEDVISEMIGFFDERMSAVETLGIKKEKIIIDPGIGFGKRLEDNITILRNLPAFKKYGLPVLMGLSRKMVLGRILADKPGNIRPAEGRLSGTLAANALSYINGASLFRVHDVREHSDLLKILKAIK